MKKIVSLLLAIFVVISFVVADTPSGRVSESVNVQVSLLNQNPDPVQPGRYVEVRFRAENLGVYSTENVVFELMPEYPFSLDPGVDARVKVGTLYGRSMGEEAATIYYKVRVDKGAVEGDNELRLKYSTDGGSSWIVLEPFDIRVQTLDAAVDITALKLTPEKIAPGSKVKLQVTVKNLADSLLQDVAFSLNLSGDTIPFVPVNSISEKRVATLGAGLSTVFEFELMAQGNAASQVYKVPITITYTDESSSIISKSDILALLVGSEPEIQMGIDSQTVYQSGKAGEISIKIVNKGVTDIKFLNLVLLPSDDYELFCCNKQYVGDLDSDDYELVDVELFVKGTDTSVVKVPVRLEYADTNNERFSEETELQLRLYTNEQMKQFGLVQGNSSVGIVIVLAIVVGGIWFYRRRKKRQSKK